MAADHELKKEEEKIKVQTDNLRKEINATISSSLKETHELFRANTAVPPATPPIPHHSHFHNYSSTTNTEAFPKVIYTLCLTISPD